MKRRPTLRSILSAGEQLSTAGHWIEAPLSCAQLSLWRVGSQSWSSPIVNLPAALSIRGTLSMSAIRRSLEAVLARHEVLRTTFHITQTTVVQRIHAFHVAPLRYLSLMTNPNDERFKGLLRDEIERPFELASEFPLRCTVVRLSPDHHVFIVVFHHLATDGWSAGLFMRELVTAYADVREMRTVSSQPSARQYRDHVADEERFLNSATAHRQMAYWRDVLSPSSEPLRWQKGGAQTAEYNMATIAIPSPLQRALDERARTAGVTVFIAMVAALKRTIHLSTGATDIRVATLVSGRENSADRNVMGLFANTIVLRSKLDGCSKPDEVLERVRSVIVSAFGNQTLPFEIVLQQMSRNAELSGSKPFEVLFVHQAFAAEPIAIAGLEITPLDLPPSGGLAGGRGIGLVIVCEQKNQELAFTFWGRPDFIDADSFHLLPASLLRAIEDWCAPRPGPR